MNATLVSSLSVSLGLVSLMSSCGGDGSKAPSTSPTMTVRALIEAAYDFSISRSGDRVLFLRSPPPSELFVASMTDLVARRIAEGAWGFAFSTDRGDVVFTKDAEIGNPPTTRLFTVRADGSGTREVLPGKRVIKFKPLARAGAVQFTVLDDEATGASSTHAFAAPDGAPVKVAGNVSGQELFFSTSESGPSYLYAFAYDRATDSHELRVASPTGENLRTFDSLIRNAQIVRGKVAYVKNAGAGTELHVKALEGSEPALRVPGAYLQALGPDGASVFYTRTEGERTVLAKRAPLSGPEIILADPAPSGHQIVVSPDARFVALSVIGLLQVVSTTPGRMPLVIRGADALSEAFSEDGQHIAYHTRFDERASTHELDVAPTAGGAPRSMVGKITGGKYAFARGHIVYLSNVDRGTDLGDLYIAKLPEGASTLLATRARSFAFVGDDAMPASERRRFGFVGTSTETGKTGLHEVVLP